PRPPLFPYTPLFRFYVSRAQYGPARWNKVNQCCGAAGTGQFFLALHRADPRPGYLDIAYLAAQFALERATREAGGIKWIPARDRSEEHTSELQSRENL